MAIISNEDGNSTLTGTAGDDTVILSPPVAPLTGQAFFPTFGSNDNDLIQTGDGDDLIRFGPGIDTIDGGAGQDRVQVSFFSAAEHGLGGVPLGGGSTGFTVYGFSVTSLLVDLGAETYQLNTVGSLQFQPSISRVFSGTIRNVEVLEGTFGNDTLRGSDREDAVEVFRSSSGVDVLDGRGGRDRLELPQNAPSGVWTIDLALGRLLRDGGVVATLAGIEDVAGSFGADLIIGTDAANEIAGYAGNDTILAGDGDDRIIMDFGFDDITLGEGADVLDLTASARGTIRDFTFLVDRFELPDIPPSAARRAGVTRAEDDGPPALRLEDAGVGSADLLVRHGNRTYATLSDGITRLSTGIMQAVDDAATTAFGARSSGGAAGGGNRGDIVTGLAAGNRLSGAGGSDTLFGFGGIDIVTGGPGNDTLFGGDGDDELISGGGSA